MHSRRDEIAVVTLPEGYGDCAVEWHVPVAHRSYAVPGLPGLFHVAADARSSESATAASERAVRRQLSRLQRLEGLLDAGRSSVGASGFCRLTGPAETPNVSAFGALRLGDRLHYVYTRGLRERPDCASRIERVNIITGSCLWSTRAVHGIAVDGTPVDVVDARLQPSRRVTSFHEDPELTLYELEGAVRLTRFVAELVAALPEDVAVGVTLDVPRVQYYCLLLDAFARGLVEPDVLLEWFERVDARHARVVELLEMELACWLDAAGVRATPEVTIAPGLDAAEELIRGHVAAGRAPALGELARALAARRELWRALLAGARPRELRDLVHWSYAVEALAGAEHDRGGRGGRALMIAVDDYAESKIYTAAERFAQHLGASAFSLLGLYPLAKVLTVRDGVHGRLYLQDPGGRLHAHAGVALSRGALLERLYERDPLQTADEVALRLAS